MELDKALRIVLETYGRELIEQDVLMNYLADYNAYGNKATRRILSTLLQIGYGEKIYKLDQQNAPDKFLIIKSYATQLAQEGFQQSHVNYVMDSICYGLGWIENPVEEPTEYSTEKLSFCVKGVEFSMIYIEGGDFDMGATPEQGIYAAFDEKPSVQITLGNYYAGECPVTQALWKAVMEDNPSHCNGDQLPVERVSWNDCDEFIKKINDITGYTFRMLTEAEWEYAARGGRKTRNMKYSGADEEFKNDVMWFKENSQTTSHEVKSKLPNELGLYDMCGNVSEWCSDWYFNSYANNGSRTNPAGPSFGIGKVYRGGSWNDKSLSCRVSKRFSMNPLYKNKLVGLRLAATTL